MKRNHNLCVNISSSHPSTVQNSCSQVKNISFHEVSLKSHSSKFGPIIGRETGKLILEPFSGRMSTGEFWAILGPSGSGKSSLLNMIANRISKEAISGEILFDNMPVTLSVSQEFGYVMQDDVLFENLTVKEMLQFVVKLKHGKVDAKFVNEKVALVAEELGFSSCLNTRIGGFLTRGLSGGEKRRVSIAIELLKDQKSVLLLDEPSSGLDSTSAYNIMHTLKQLAHARNKLVIASIHQPHSRTFKLFDKVLLLSQGKIIYMGDSSKLLAHFSAAGYPAPELTNPSDHILELVSIDYRCKKSEKICSDRIEFLAKFYKNSSLYQHNVECANESLACKQKSPLLHQKMLEKANGNTVKLEWFRFLVLLQRNFREQCRAKLPLIFRACQAIVLSLIMGILYGQIGNDYESIFDRQGALFYVAVQQSLGSIFIVLNTFQREKRIYCREHSQGLYGSLPYYCAKVFSELPLLIPTPLIFVFIVYPLVGFRFYDQYMLIAVLCFLIINVAAQSLGLMISSLSPSARMANIVTPIILSVLLLFGGLMVNIESIPPYFSWISNINHVKYAYEILSFNDLNNLPLTCSEEILQQLGKCPLDNGTQVLQQMSMASVNILNNFLILLAIIFGFNILAYMGLLFVKPNHI